MSKLLTIAIPTFNRAAIIKAQVQELLAADICHLVELLIIDDGSSDTTYFDLVEVCAGTPVQVLRNDINLGYAGNFFELFIRAQTPYIMCSTDDDHILVGKIVSLIEYLGDQRPAFVAPQFLLDGVYRGRTKTGRIRAENYRDASAHAPGLVYDRHRSLEIIRELTGRLKDGCAATVSYPQVLLACNLMVRHGGWWWQGATVMAGEQLPTGIRPDGAAYYSLSSRWAQHKSFVDYFAIKVVGTEGKERADWQKMASATEKRIFKVIRGALARERSDLVARFDDEARFYYAGRMSKIIRKPGYIGVWIKKLWRRISAMGKSSASIR